MNPEQRDRSAAMYDQRMRMTNGAVPMAPPMGPRRHPNGGPSPGIQPVPRPSPPKVAPVARLTGPNPKIPSRMDPANRYHNLPGGEQEKMQGSSGSNDDLGGVRQALSLVLIILLASSVFVMPREYRFFWLTIFGLAIIMCIGMRLYSDLFEASKNPDETEEKRQNMKTLAGVVIYGEFILYAFVMAAILIVLAWKLYGQVNRRSNLLSNTEPETAMQQEKMEQTLQRPMQRRMKEKKRRPKFI